MNKISGFTLIEIIIALAISSLVMLSALSIYYITFKNSMDFHQNAKNKITFLQILNRVQNDIYNCQKVINHNNTLLMEFSGYNITYQFSDDRVVINAPSATDTIVLDINNLTCKFNNYQITEGRVDEITWSVFIQGVENEVSIKKRYDAVGYLK